MHALKRLTDITLAAFGLILLAPALGLVALAIWLSTGRPILFRQVRPGYRGRPFCLLKFRTMSGARSADGRLQCDSERLTHGGAFLRRWSIDELPQLWNVLRGEMSLVGPRPLLMEYLEAYTPEQARRHDVKPGMTGWAQVHGRQDLLFSKRLEMDVWYVDHSSYWLDLKLILLTLWRLPSLSGVGARPDLDKTDDLGLFALIRNDVKN